MTIRNRGEKPTTVEEIMLVHQRRGIGRFFLPPQMIENLSVKHRSEIQLPTKIGYSEVWNGLCEFHPEERIAFNDGNKGELLRQGRLFYYIRCAHTDRLIRGRVRNDIFDLFE